MSTKSMIVLLSFACLISVLQVANAFKFKPCDRTSGDDILSIKIDQCPRANGECCQFDPSKPLSYEMKFKSRRNFQQAFTMANLAKHSWISDFCKNNSSCPGNVGDVITMGNQLDAIGASDKSTGDLVIRVINENMSSLTCVQFPACAARPSLMSRFKHQRVAI